MASGAGTLLSDKKELNAFWKTEVELSKAKQLYSSLEKRLDHERIEYSQDYRRLNEKHLAEKEKSASLQARVFELEAELHKEKIGRYAKLEEETSKRRVLEDDLKRQKAKYESRISLLEEEVKNTKDVWTARLAEERKSWRSKATEKTDTLQDQVDKTRDFYKGQVEHLHRELAEVLGSRRTVKEELELVQVRLEDEKRKRKMLRLELEESKDKYRRCLNLASDLVAMRKNRSYGTASHECSTTRHSLSFLVREDDESIVLRKQLKLTQTLLDEELHKNHDLRNNLARLSAY